MIGWPTVSSELKFRFPRLNKFLRMSLRPPRGFHDFIRDRVVPAFKEQRGINQNQFAVLLLVSENEFKDLNSMEFHPSEVPLTDCCEVSMPHERSQYRNYIVARYENIRDSDEVSTDYHSEETIVSELDHLWEGYMEFTNGTPPTCFILYSWNFPCTDCTETIISALKRPPYKGISMIVVFSQHWRGETSRGVYHNRKEMRKKGIYFTKVNGVKLNDSESDSDSDDSSESESDDSDIIDGDDADSDDQYDFDDNIDWGNIPDTHDDDHDLSDLQDCDDRSDDHNDTYDFDDDDPDIDDLQGFDDDHDNSYYDVTDNSDEDSIASSDHDDTYDFDDDDPDIDDLQGFDDDHDNSYYDVTDNSDEDSSDHDDITDFDESETDDNGFLYDTNETIVYNMVLYMCSNIIDAGLDSDDSYDTSSYDDEYEDY